MRKIMLGSVERIERFEPETSLVEEALRVIGPFGFYPAPTNG
jgi:hypothetical protein